MQNCSSAYWPDCQGATILEETNDLGKAGEWPTKLQHQKKNILYFNLFPGLKQTFTHHAQFSSCVNKQRFSTISTNLICLQILDQLFIWFLNWTLCIKATYSMCTLHVIKPSGYTHVEYGILSWTACQIFTRTVWDFFSQINLWSKCNHWLYRKKSLWNINHHLICECKFWNYGGLVAENKKCTDPLE